MLAGAGSSVCGTVMVAESSNWRWWVQSLVVRALSCAHRQSSPSLCPVPPLFSPREEPEPWCKPRTLQGASTSFEYNGRLQYWTVPETGVYRITARGAKAADGHHRCAA